LPMLLLGVFLLWRACTGDGAGVVASR
jgi:hypothetical protein